MSRTCAALLGQRAEDLLVGKPFTVAVAELAFVLSNRQISLLRHAAPTFSSGIELPSWLGVVTGGTEARQVGLMQPGPGGVADVRTAWRVGPGASSWLGLGTGELGGTAAAWMVG